MSDSLDFFDSAAFDNHRKDREGAQKLTIANLMRLDTVVKAIGSIGRLLSNQGKRGL